MGTEEVLVVATRFRLRSLRLLPAFMRASNASAAQARQAPGYLGGRLLADVGLTFWTLTLWDSEQAMRQWRNRGAHLGAMRQSSSLVREADVARWRQVDSTLPSWREVGRRMRAESQTMRGLPASTQEHRDAIRPPRRGVARPLPPQRQAGLEQASSH